METTIIMMEKDITIQMEITAMMGKNIAIDYDIKFIRIDMDVVIIIIEDIVPVTTHMILLQVQQVPPQVDYFMFLTSLPVYYFWFVLVLLQTTSNRYSNAQATQVICPTQTFKSSRWQQPPRSRQPIQF
jgi:hypothetical protein